MTASRRTLGETMVDVVAGALGAGPASPLIRVRQIVLSLPVEVALRRAGDTWELLADVPRLVTRTAFDLEPGRLEVVWSAGEQP